MVADLLAHLAEKSRGPDIVILQTPPTEVRSRIEQDQTDGSSSIAVADIYIYIDR